MKQGFTQREKELTDWYDKQCRATQWRIVAYVIEYRRPLAETLSFFKAMDYQDRSYIRLVHSNPQQRH